MDVCIKCNSKATWQCDCRSLLCSQHMEPHLDEAPNHKISKFRPNEISETQRNYVGKILIQLQMLDQCSQRLISDSNIFIQEVSKLVKDSLQRIQEKRVEMLTLLQRMSTLVISEGVRQFSVSEIDIARKTSSDLMTQEVPLKVINSSTFKEEKMIEEALKRRMDRNSLGKLIAQQSKKFVVPQKSFHASINPKAAPQKKKDSSGCTPQ